MKIQHPFRLFAALALAFAAVCVPAQAAWPDRPITIIVPWGAGGAADGIARLLANQLERDFKQPVNVVNRTGGSGVVGHQAIVNAKPDGYTFGLATVEITMFQHQGLANFTHRDFSIAAIVNTDAGGVIVRSDSPYTSAKQLIDDIKAKPEKTFKASGSGQGSIWHLGLVGWLLDQGVDPKKVPWVPSQGSAPAMQDVVAGGVDFVTASLPEGRTFMDAGKARGLANMDKKRLSQYPTVPTLKEATGSDWTILTWRAVVAPANVPKPIMDKFVASLKKAHATKEFRDFMNDRGFGYTWIGPDESRWMMDASFVNFRRVMKSSGMIQ